METEQLKTFRVTVSVEVEVQAFDLNDAVVIAKEIVSYARPLTIKSYPKYIDGYCVHPYNPTEDEE